jgi:type IV secretion system protein TrbL
MAERVLGHVISSGIKLLVLAVITGIGVDPVRAQFMEAGLGTEPDIQRSDGDRARQRSRCSVLASSVRASPTESLPGGPQLGAGAAAGTTLAAGATIAAGAAGGDLGDRCRRLDDSRAGSGGCFRAAAGSASGLLCSRERCGQIRDAGRGWFGSWPASRAISGKRRGFAAPSVPQRQLSSQNFAEGQAGKACAMPQPEPSAADGQPAWAAAMKRRQAITLGRQRSARRP